MPESRFEDAPSQVITVVETVKDKWFPELDGARIKVVFDLKKRTSGDKLILGRIVKANGLTRFLTIEEAESSDGFDYFLFLDKKIWEVMEVEDQIRLVRHELRHTNVDVEKENDPFKLRPHDIEDFYDEIELNKDDPRWAERVVTVAEAIYEAEKEEKKAQKNKGGGNEITYEEPSE